MNRRVSSVIWASAFLLAAAMPSAAAGDAKKGEAVFKRCAACHTTTLQNRVGPGLGGVVGRKAGSVEGYKYSGALASSTITWDDHALDAFLAAPAKAVPGTKMMLNLPKQEDRDNVVEYLKTIGGEN